jgi:hydroxyethylthiazole kinase-like uncharacterized protein yjeF
MKTHVIDQTDIRKIYKKPAPDAHKGTQGHALLIGGSRGKIGSVVLATKAALRAGCGLLTAFVPQCGSQILQISVPEAMVLTGKGKKRISGIEVPFQPNAIGIGMGMGKTPKTAKAFGKYIAGKAALVIDADGLNILAEHPHFLRRLAPQTILTPHKGELERLIGKWGSEAEEHQGASAFAKKYKVIIVDKGAPTVILDGESMWRNTTGNAALATGGSGDSLTGMITSLLAQGYSPLDAAKLGVYLHGLTADIALPATGTASFTAGDIAAYLGKAFLSLEEAV